MQGQVEATYIATNRGVSTLAVDEILTDGTIRVGDPVVTA